MTATHSLQKNSAPRKTLRLAVPYLLPYRCVSPQCKRNLSLRRHITYLPSTIEKCPHCQERGYFIKLAVIHLLQPTQFGIIKANRWCETNADVPANQRSDFLCEASKKGFKELAKSPNQPRHYTNDLQATTCFYCLKEYDKINFPRGKLITEF